jgi:hypothetical protein
MDVRLPDGTVIQNVPEGTTKAQLVQKLSANGMNVPAEWMPKEAPSVGSMFKDELMTSLPGGIARGVKDVIDTGAGWLSNLGGSDEAARIRVMNEQGKADFRAAQERTGNTVVPAIGRVGGQILATNPVVKTLGAAATLANVPRLGAAITSGGMTTGKAVAPGLLSRVADTGIRMAGGATAGGVSAGLVDPESAGTGAVIGGALPLIAPAAKAVGSGIRRGLGATTGVGDEALSQAYQAGKAGGTQARQFTAAMRGESSIDDALTMAKQNIARMGDQKQQAYRAGMANIKSDKSVLSFDGIDDALKSARSMAMFKGQAKNPKTAQLVQQVSDEVAAWKALDPTEYHTTEGLDALKQRVGGVLESIPFEEKTARSAVGNIYSSIKGEINKQAPEYARVMKDYSEATELVREIEKTLSVGQKSMPDTAVRKLQSLMRNNVNTSYGYRDQLAQKMMEQGGNNLLPTLAGQSLSDWAPRGIQRATAGTGTGLLAITGNIPAAAGMAGISSPRLVGEAAYGAGRLAGQQGLLSMPQMLYRTTPLIPAQQN